MQVKAFKPLLTLALLFGFMHASAQCVTVLDAQTGETLIGAVVQTTVQNASLSDDLGRACLQNARLGDSVQVRYQGYGTIAFLLPAKDTVIRLLTIDAEIDEVTITSTRNGVSLEASAESVVKVSPKTIEATNSVKLDEAMDRVGGVSVVNGQMNIRGSSGFSYGAGTRVIGLLDGLPILSADASDIKWNFLPIEQLETIEIIKGPASSLYGSSALGGVMNLIPRFPKSTFAVQSVNFVEVYGQPRNPLNQFRTGNPYHFGTAITVDLPTRYVKSIISLNAVNDDGYRAGESSRRVRVGVDLVPVLKTQKLLIRLRATAMIDSGQNFIFWQGKDNELQPFNGTSSPQYNTRIAIDPSAQYALTPKMVLKVKGRSYVTNNLNQTGQSSFGIVNLAEGSLNGTVRNFNIATGVFAQHNLVNSDSLYGRHTSRNFAVFAQIARQYRRLYVVAGLRRETFQTDDLDVKRYGVGRLALSYRAAKATYLRASFGQGFRNPSLAELFVRTSAGALQVFPNPELEPERGKGYEFGIRQVLAIKKVKCLFDVAYFNTDYKNFSEFTFGVFLPPGVPPSQSLDFLGFKSLNSNRAMIRGIDAMVQGQVITGKLSHTVMLAYTYTNATADSMENIIPLKYRYPDLIRADYQIDGKFWTAGINLRYNSLMTAVDIALLELIPGSRDFRTEKSKGDVILDLRAGIKIKSRIQLNFLIKNILNEEYMVVPGNLGQQRSFVFQQTLRF